MKYKSHAPDFTPTACRTYHDITRYIHEQAVAELIDLSESRQGILDASARKLRSTLPLNLSIIDLDSEASDDTSTVDIDGLDSLPLRELLTGLTASGMIAETYETVGEDLPASERQEMMRHIQKECGRIHAIVTNLLDFSKPKATSMQRQ